MDYTYETYPHQAERVQYGATSERGKADLMFLQHMLWHGQAGGPRRHGLSPSCRTACSSGAAVSRTSAPSLLEKDAIEAVIGLAPNLFYGTGIPACILVLRPPGQKDRDREGQVLFVNADREYHAERAQNVLLPEHVEKIVTTFRATGRRARLRPVGRARGAAGERLQHQHPPLRGQHARRRSRRTYGLI